MNNILLPLVGIVWTVVVVAAVLVWVRMIEKRRADRKQQGRDEKDVLSGTKTIKEIQSEGEEL